MSRYQRPIPPLNVTRVIFPWSSAEDGCMWAAWGSVLKATHDFIHYFIVIPSYDNINSFFIYIFKYFENL